MIILNFAHPLTEEQLRQVAQVTGLAVKRVISIDTCVDLTQLLGPQVEALADACGLSTEEWQTLPLVINPPSLNFVAITLLAELHGRCGYFPAHLALRPVEDSVPRRFEVAEVLDLQGRRDSARRRRGVEMPSSHSGGAPCR